MKKIGILLFLLFNQGYCYAQTDARDSLIQLIRHDKEDTSRVINLAALSFEHLESDPDTAMKLALEALFLARRIDFEKGEAVSLNRVGNVFSVVGNYPRSMEAFLQALKINEKLNNYDGIQRNYNNIGSIYLNQEDYRQALTYLYKAKSIAEQLRNKRSISVACDNISTAYYFLKIYDSARLYAQQAYDTAHKINYGRLVGNTLYKLGAIHFKLGQNTLALEYYRLSIPPSIKAQNELTLSQVYLDMAKLFDTLHQKDSSLFYARQSLILTVKKGFTMEIRDVAQFLSDHFSRLKNADSAFFYQRITKTANDSLFSQQKIRQLQSLGIDEILRQQEITAADMKIKEERKRNLQYAAIFVGLISFIILFFVLSRSIIVKEKFIKFAGIIGLLAVFEFINLYIHPYLDKLTNHSPFWMLAILICIGALLVPLHHRVENWITKFMVEKNKKIRLEAAKKTIEQLEERKV